MYITKIRTELNRELDTIELEKAIKLVSKMLTDKDFINELTHKKQMLQDRKNYLRDEEILVYLLLGMGRNRTINILENLKVTRRHIENVQKYTDLKNSSLKKENEKNITALKWEMKTRKRREEKLSENDWSKICSLYKNGAHVSHLSKQFNISSYIITGKLKEVGVYDESRSTILKKSIASENYKDIDNQFLMNLVKNNPLDSKESLWRKAQIEYPWLLRRQMDDKLEELNLKRSEDEVNELRRIKSKNEQNESYQVKVNGHKAVIEVFGSLDNLVSLYMKNTLGSFNKIAEKINKNITFDYEITAKQVSKIITNHSSYKRTSSLGQKQLFSFVKNTFSDLDVIEEFPLSKNKKIDVYIPKLNVGFEFNGEYWHSNEVIKYNYGLTAKEFHKQRAKLAKEKNIKLLYVWEDDWNHNYKEIESEIRERNWNSSLLNKHENITKRSDEYYSPDRKSSVLRSQVMRFLKEKGVDFYKANNSHLIEILDKNIIINIPNYNSLENEKECLNLQKYYEEKNVELLTFLPWRNIFKIKDFLSYKLELSNIKKIPARKCQVNIVDKITKTERDFFSSNHLLGYNNFKYIDKTITLKWNDEILIAALFTKNPKNNHSELKRLVSKHGYSVQGGASKIISHYLKTNNNIKEIITFSDCDLGFGNVYKSLGFSLIERSKEQLTWVNDELDMRFSNLSLVMVGADRLLRNIEGYEEVGIGDNLPTNQEIVKRYGFKPVYDSGYKKWILEVDKVCKKD